MNTIGTRELRTARLLLRKPQIEDAIPLHEAGILGSSPEDAQNILQNMIRYNDDPMNFHWVLCLDGLPIGRIKAWEVNPRDDYAQLGYDLAPSHRCQGYMTEAVRRVCEYLLNDAGMHRVYCMVRESNLPSIRVCEKAGLRYEGFLRQHFKQPDGSFVNVRVYGLLREEIASSAHVQ